MNSYNKEKRIKSINSFKKKNKKCKTCGKTLSYKKRYNTFCNLSCAAKTINIGKRKGLGSIKNIRNCLRCGNPLIGRSKRNNIYCSQECATKEKWERFCKEVESLEYFKDYDGSHSGSGVSRPKKYILEKQDGKCAICGISEWMGKPAPFILDHINGNAENWKLNNLRIVCGNCDMQLPTYKSKNKGKSKRKYRMQPSFSEKKK